MRPLGPLHPIDLSQPPAVRYATAWSRPHAGTVRYRLQQLWAIHLYDYDATLEIAGQALAIAPGTVSLTPAGMPVRYHWPEPSRHMCVHFALAGAPDGTCRAPLLQALDDAYEPRRAQLRAVTAAWPHRPALARARLWDLLWSLVRIEDEDEDEGAAHERSDPVQRALHYLDAHLNEPVRLADVAAHVGLSHNQLIRRFRAARGTTPGAYLRDRRAERARYLLRETTLPIQSIAVEVGMPDLQHFNKWARRALGAAPTTVRASDA